MVAIAFFALCGYAPARTLVRGELEPHRALLVLPLGAAISALSLAILGLLHVPLTVSLVVVILAAAAATAGDGGDGAAAPGAGARRRPTPLGTDSESGCRCCWPPWSEGSR